MSKVIEERVLSRIQVELAIVESVIKEESIVRSVPVGEVGPRSRTIITIRRSNKSVHSKLSISR